jgi:hypothetical protein
MLHLGNRRDEKRQLSVEAERPPTLLSRKAARARHVPLVPGPSNGLSRVPPCLHRNALSVPESCNLIPEPDLSDADGTLVGVTVQPDDSRVRAPTQLAQQS